MIFGSDRDFGLLTKINRELLKDVVEQEILYYKISLDDTETNLYGESLRKVFYTPIKLNCLITRGDQVVTTDEYGPDLNREVSFAFLREDMTDIELVPEVGDIVLWHEDYYEADTVRENQLFLGRDNNYNFTTYGSKFGRSVSLILDCHLTRADRVGIAEVA
tara:strand:+ start:392 stop:877 length:486 start_codon:yes stop_codon:yes gene_type:complete